MKPKCYEKYNDNLLASTTCHCSHLENGSLGFGNLLKPKHLQSYKRNKRIIQSKSEECQEGNFNYSKIKRNIVPYSSNRTYFKKYTKRPNMKNLRFKFQPIFVVGKLMKTIFLGIADITSITNLFSEWEVQNSSDLSLCITMA